MSRRHRKTKPARGRPRTYGVRHKLTDVFETHKASCTQAECEVYGRVEPVSYLVRNLLWKPLKAQLRFCLCPYEPRTHGADV